MHLGLVVEPWFGSAWGLTAVSGWCEQRLGNGSRMSGSDGMLEMFGGAVNGVMLIIVAETGTRERALSIVQMKS